ncbi:glutathione S-transferase [Pseudohongiella acticola]|uniref:Glutathione S-transferase n=1 Tax=Pseudohongiella acticola TaxID=1524254 RepID=A0A1E8CME1_9GAMM|nr:glutathione S-transferase family protein [Pseudohongiella acticola]OFE13452.1 glutathione S-transferase [Pseudohongiella acticola]
MREFVVTTYDWVPEVPRGYVRDLRIRWALEEAELPYRVEATSFRDRGAEHFLHQPFGQAPWLTHGEISISESGAILLYIGEFSQHLMPTTPKERAKVIEWVFAALNSVEMASLPWSLFKFTNDEEMTAGRNLIEGFLSTRLKHMEQVFEDREWLTEAFSIADILMSDVLRLVDRFDGLAEYPLCHSFVERATARPAFAKALEDQLAHFAASD